LRSKTMPYNFLKSFERIDEILNASSAYEELDYIPKRDKLTFTNGYYVKCNAIFIDVRGSSSLPQKYRRPSLAKLYRSYISELVAILNSYEECKEVNIVGDCVSGIFEAQKKEDTRQAYESAYTIYSLVKALNYKLCRKGISPIKIGIGIAKGRALMIKAGYRGSTVSEVVWMGDVVNEASNLCSLANKKYASSLVIGESVFTDLPDTSQEFFKKEKQVSPTGYKNIYHANIHRKDMEKWLKDMQAEKPCSNK